MGSPSADRSPLSPWTAPLPPGIPERDMSGRNPLSLGSVYRGMKVRRVGLKASAAALLCAVLAGCGDAASTSSTPGDGDSKQQDGVVLSADSADNVAYPAAILTGRLMLRDGCLALDGLPTLWPAGSEWDEEGLAVVLADGTRLAVGDRVEFGGGLVPASVASNYSLAAQEPVDLCMRSLGAREMALISGTVQ